MRVETAQIYWHDKKPVYSIDFHPADPARFATAGGDNAIRVWRLDGSGHVKYVASLNRHSRAVNCVRFAPHGALLASAGDGILLLSQCHFLGGLVMLWQRGGTSASQIDQQEAEEDGAEEHWSTVSILRLAEDDDILDLAWSPDGQWLLAGTSANCAVLFDASTGRVVRTFKDHCHYVQGVAWDPLDQHIATASADRTVKLWRIVEKASRKSAAAKRLYTPMHKLSRLDGQPMFHDESLVTFFRRLCFTPDGMHLMLPAAFDGSGKSGVMLVKRAELETPLGCLPGFDKPPLAIRCNPRLFRPRRLSEGSGEVPRYRIVFAVASRSAILIYDTQDFMPLCSYTGLHYGVMTDLAWSADGRTLVMASQDGFCSIAEFELGELGEVMAVEEQEEVMREIKREHCTVATQAQQCSLMTEAVVLSSDPIVLEAENLLGESNLLATVSVEDATTKAACTQSVNDLSRSIKRRIAQTLLSSLPAQASADSNAMPRE